VRNYLNNLAKGKDIEEPIVFQGGVAANVGIVAAFERAIGKKIIIPQHYDVMGAYGAALIAKEEMMKNGKKHQLLWFDNIHNDFRARSIECNGCSNMCEVIEIVSNDAVVACWGDRCGKWSAVEKGKSSVG